MIDLEKIIHCENTFPATFAQVVEKPYGKIYFNLENSQSHDSNHAVILNLDVDLRDAVDDISAFYRAKGLVPLLYQAYQPGEKEALFPILHEKGFTIGEFNENSFFLYENGSVVQPVEGGWALNQSVCERCPSTKLNGNFHIRRVNSVGEEVRAIILSEDEGDWAYKVLARQVEREDVHLLVGFNEDKAVAVLSVSVSENGYSRVDDVVTHADHRGRGYGSALVNYMVKYHREVSRNQLYLYASNPVAIRIYEVAGFVKKELPLACWGAWLGDCV